MKTTRLTALFLLSLVTIVIWKGNATAQMPDNRPNIIYILTDDMGYSDVAFAAIR